MTSAQAWAEQQNAYNTGMLGQQAGMQNMCAVEKQQTLGSQLERALKRADMLSEAITQLRDHLGPVLNENYPPEKDAGTPVNEGSPAMRMAGELINRLDQLHRAVNEIQRRAAL